MSEKKAVIAFVFPQPDDDDVLGLQAVVGKARTIFADRNDVRVYAAIREPAETIISVLTEGKEESGLVDHAKRELERIDNDFEFNESIIKAVRAFSSYGHSGGSASVAIPMLNDLLHYKNLTPLTNDPKEWNDVSAESGIAIWQSTRNPEAFSEDGGKTYYLLSEDSTDQRIMHISASIKKKEEKNGNG